MSRSGRNQTLGEGKLYTSKAGWYSLRYPANWVAEEDEECTTFSDPQSGVGALQVSAYETPTYQDCKETLLEYLSDHGVSVVEGNAKVENQDGKCIASYSYTQGLWFRSVWFISEDHHLLMITYNCKIEHLGKEDREVDELVASVTIEPTDDLHR